MLLEVELVQAVVCGGAVAVVVRVAGVEVRLLLHSLPVPALLTVQVRFVFLEARELGVAPEADMRVREVGGGGRLVPQPGVVVVSLRPLVGLVVVVTDAVVSASLAQHGHLWRAVQTVVRGVIDGGAGAVRPQAGRGLLGGVVLVSLATGEVQRAVVFSLALPH